MPTMNTEEMYDDGDHAAAFGSVSTRKIGIQPRFWCSHRDRYTSRGWSTSTPHSP